MPRSKRYDVERRKGKCTLNCFTCHDDCPEDTGDDNDSTPGTTVEPQCDTDHSSFSQFDTNKEVCDKAKINVEGRDGNYEMRDMEFPESDMESHESDISESSTATVIEPEPIISNCCQCESSLTTTQDQALLNKIDEQGNEIERLRKAVENIALNPTYIKLSRCENIALSHGGGDIDDYTGQIRNMLDGLCENYDKLKGTVVTILEKVEEIQAGSTEQRAELQKLAEGLKTILNSPGSPVSDDTKQDSKYCSLNSLVDSESPCQDGEDCRCIVWGRSNVLRDLKDTQVKILSYIVDSCDITF
ncbi:uncharacterized protein LOC110440323 [Mizuhopecten yessoensis]|uniref:uncharacterized protein LOC110440323 n=1 Tax=Mizuhopecten yessoensis TaxID=6573 RepID=UPI000B458DF7|nr:uncharacterized protein LOC110440323 [Mizuhopecten yessoensis]